MEESKRERLERKLNRKKNRLKRVEKDTIERMGIDCLTNSEVNAKYNYFGGWSVGYYEGRTEGFMMALDILEQFGIDGFLGEEKE